MAVRVKIDAYSIAVAWFAQGEVVLRMSVAPQLRIAPPANLSPLEPFLIPCNLPLKTDFRLYRRQDAFLQDKSTRVTVKGSAYNLWGSSVEELYVPLTLKLALREKNTEKNNPKMENCHPVNSTTS